LPSTILLFPGQGAQRVGMAADLSAAFPAARDTLAAIDKALGVPLSRLMAEGPEDELQMTHNAQPAILAHSAAVLAVLEGRLGSVVAAAGHSLGEYTGYLAAGALTAPDAARLVRRRGELMREAGLARPGAMAAVLGLATADVEAACTAASNPQDGVVVAANQNAPDQTVISGDPGAVEAAGAGCKERGAKRVLPLRVSGAFHSPLMAPAVAGLAVALAEASWRTPRFPVVANASATPVTDPAQARRLLAEQLTAPVRWVECIETAAALDPDARFLEIGPGTVLAGLLKRIRPQAICSSLGTIKDLEAFAG
jgi:[acyl-carrier-protein] S-malonyltransferase